MSPAGAVLRAFVLAVDRMAGWAAVAAATTLTAVGFLIGIEVALRWFGHPTKWTAEVAQIAQIWCVFLASAYVLKRREMITVDILSGDDSRPVFRLFDMAAILFIAVFCLVVMRQGLRDAARTIHLGTTTDTALALPMWVIQMALPVGLGLLFLQCCAELLKYLPPLADPARDT